MQETSSWTLKCSLSDPPAYAVQQPPNKSKLLNISEETFLALELFIAIHHSETRTPFSDYVSQPSKAAYLKISLGDYYLKEVIVVLGFRKCLARLPGIRLAWRWRGVQVSCVPSPLSGWCLNSLYVRRLNVVRHEGC